MKTLCVLSLLFGISLYVEDIQAQKCNCACTFDYKPICAADSTGEEQTYPNRCALNCYKCTHGKSLTIRKYGECSGSSSTTQTPNESDQRPATKCNCECPMNYSPVCARDSSGVEETYPNRCAFECYKCTHNKGKDYVIRKQGECSPPSNTRPGGNRPRNPPPPAKCNCECPLNYSPVCAGDSNGVEETYPNRCAFECYKCTHNKGKDYVIRKQGECSPPSNTRSGGNRPRNPPPPAKCNCECPLNYSPVCAGDSNGVEETYPNRCAFECYKCTHNKGKDYVIRKQGECSPPSNTRPGGNRPRNPPPPAKCNCECPLNYFPVCAGDSNGGEETYPNRCAFECYKCTHNKGKDYVIRKQGECSPPSNTRSGGNRPRNPPPPAKCNCECPLNYSPVCAGDSNGVEETYPNRCAFECYKCTHNKRKDYVIRKQGECSPPSNTRPGGNRPRNPPPPAKCNCECPLNYSPVCAGDSNGVEETYPNRCAFECYKCTHNKGKDYVIRKQGECSPASNTRPGGNRPRNPSPPAKCNCECPLNYSPVCAGDSSGVEETYPNRCAFECYKCTHNKNYLIKKNGECTTKQIRPTPTTRRNNHSPRELKCAGICSCPDIYSPVCVVDSSGAERTFASRCDLDCYICTENGGYTLRGQGYCGVRPVGRPTKSRS